MTSNNRFYPRADALRQEIEALDKPVILDLYDTVVEADKNYDTSIPHTLRTYNRAMVALCRELIPTDERQGVCVPNSTVIIIYKLLIKFNVFVYKNDNFRTQSIFKAQQILNDDRATDECKDVVRVFIDIHSERNPLEALIIRDDDDDNFQLRPHSIPLIDY